ncbi:MAG: SDR family oxidoreductase [Sciscionella sp.]
MSDNGVAVVTGAARGFGLAIAERLIDRDYRVLLADLDADGVHASAERLGPRASAVLADVRLPGDHAAVAEAAQRLGRLAVWVNNAGVARAGKAWEQTDSEVTLTIEVNLLGMIFGSRAAVAAMRTHGGHIMNIASMSALGPVPGLAVYAASKAGVLNFSTSLQGDLKRARVPIRVHAVCPDAADTALVGGVRGQEDSAILFSGNGLLDPGEVADRAVAMLQGRRIVAAFPAYRSVLARVGALAPTLGLAGLSVMRRLGERRRVR